jgi:hypothetical protein
MALGLLGVLTTGGGRLMNESAVELLERPGFVVLMPGVVVGIPGVVVGMPGVTAPLMGAGAVRFVLGGLIGGRSLLGTLGKPGPRTCPGAGAPVAVLPVALLPMVVWARAAPVSAANGTIHSIRVAARMVKSPLG